MQILAKLLPQTSPGWLQTYFWCI